MQITIHRGLNQIGGCITEISTETSRVFIDFGKNLPGVDDETETPTQKEMYVCSILNQNILPNEAIFYTHGHSDHIGWLGYIAHRFGSYWTQVSGKSEALDPDSRYIPQYMSEGTKQLLCIKQEVLQKRLNLVKDKFKAIEQQNQPTKAELEEYGHYIEEVNQSSQMQTALDECITWQRPKRTKDPEPIQIGDIKVTPFFNCHSVYDSHMFLIEADGKRIWHTGDYREHGYMGKGLFPTLKKYATDIDVLITEGTMLKRDAKCIHEREVSMKMTNVMKAFKYVFVLASATDIERLAAIKEATKSAGKDLYVWSLFMKRTMEFFTERESKISRGLFSFEPLFFSDIMFNKAKRKGMCMVVGTSQKSRVEALIKRLPQEETLLIYSSWDGYYKDPEQVKVNPKYKEFREMFHNVVDIHTSGHADAETIAKVIKTVNPREGIIGIHKEANTSLTALDLPDELKAKIILEQSVTDCLTIH